MDRQTECASEQTWRQFVAGGLAVVETESLQAHAASCSVCGELVRHLRQSAAAPPDQCPPTQPQQTPQEAMKSLDLSLTKTRSFLNAKDGTPHGGREFELEAELDVPEFDASLMTPAVRPDSMGRLGKYDVLEVLGRGAFGVVLKAFDEQLRRSVAIKILNRAFSSSATARRRFIREGRAAAAVSHPNVVAIHAVEEQSGVPFLVMEFVNGPSLRERINEKNKLAPLEVIRLGAQIAAGLAAAHAQGVVHRDIKPGNIMLEANVDRVKITDFGLARVVVDNVELTSRGMAVGTPAYMAPEQVMGDKVDARSDLFALGCVLYAGLVGHSPFQGRTAFEMARRVADFEPAPVQQVDASIPAFLSDLIARLLKKNPEDRYQSAAEVSDLLGRYLAALNQSPSDKFQSVLHAPFKPDPEKTALERIAAAGSRRWRPGIVAAVIGFAVLGGGFWLWRANSFDRIVRDERFTEGPGKIVDDPNSTVSTITKSSPATAEPQKLTVAQTGEAQFRTLNAALAQATPNSTIRVLDSATYREYLRINDPRRLSGLKLIAEKRATLAPANSDAATPRLIEISQVTGVLLKGWKITAPRAGHAIYLVEVGHITLENLEIEQPADVGAFGAIQVNAQRSKTADGPIEITGCRITSNGDAQCVWIQATSQPPSEIRLTRNRFERRTTTGTNVVLWVGPGDTLSKLVIRENVFVNGNSALNLQLKGQLPAHSLDIVNNTFFQAQHWLAFTTQQASDPVTRAANNLIIGGERILTDTREDLDQAARNWEFRANWWERGALTDLDANRGGMIAESKPEQSLPFLSRDPDHQDFLRPAADAQWLNAGIGGTELKYLGAFGPDPEKPN